MFSIFVKRPSRLWCGTACAMRAADFRRLRDIAEPILLTGVSPGRFA